MKRIIFSLIMLLSIIDIKAQLIRIEETDDSELVVRRTGKLNIYYTTIQFELYLPNGMSLSVDKVKLASHLTNHELLTEDLGNGRMLFMIYSPQNEPLLGELLRLPIEVTLGENTMGAIKHIVLGTFDGISLPTDDISFSMGTAIQEQPVTITANDLTMTYGDDVPKLTYKSEGAELNGTPSLTTTATKTSPVGTYPITVTKGTVTNEQVTYVAGTLTITKAPLTVGVKNETITEGDAIPAFTLTYDGFRNSDTEATAFTKSPVAKTTATPSSPAGTYPITVSGGEAQNYALTYGQGTLTIEEKEVDGVSSVKADEQPNSATYNLAGQKVNAQYKGIVIRNGKKVMK